MEAGQDAEQLDPSGAPAAFDDAEEGLKAGGGMLVS
jgi:hypothetical protein